MRPARAPEDSLTQPHSFVKEEIRLEEIKWRGDHHSTGLAILPFRERSSNSPIRFFQELMIFLNFILIPFDFIFCNEDDNSWVKYWYIDFSKLLLTLFNFHLASCDITKKCRWHFTFGFNFSIYKALEYLRLANNISYLLFNQMRMSKVKWLCQGHTIRQWRSQNSKELNCLIAIFL